MSQPCPYCHFLKTVDAYRLLHDGVYWQVALSPDQQYLGKTFVLLKRHAEAVRDLTSDEAHELFVIMKQFENAVDKAFQPTHFNWSCLMNNAAGTGEPFHVHWHAIPRYKEARELGGVEFIDQRWPKSARDMEPHTPVPAVLEAIKDRLIFV